MSEQIGENGSGVDRARAVVTRMLRDCPWHAEQTHASLVRYMIEESAETADAIAEFDPSSGAQTALAEELGDVLYQVLFHAAIAERDHEGYTLDSLADRLADKLIARHPHVFGDRQGMTVDDLNREWEHLKEAAAGQRRGSRGVFAGIPRALATLAKAHKMVDRMIRANPAARIEPGLSEAGTADGTVLSETTAPEGLTEATVAQQLLAVIEDATRAGIDPDLALRRALLALEAEHAQAPSDQQSADQQERTRLRDHNRNVEQ